MSVAENVFGKTKYLFILKVLDRYYNQSSDLNIRKYAGFIDEMFKSGE